MQQKGIGSRYFLFKVKSFSSSSFSSSSSSSSSSAAASLLCCCQDALEDNNDSNEYKVSEKYAYVHISRVLSFSIFSSACEDGALYCLATTGDILIRQVGALCYCNVLHHLEFDWQGKHYVLAFWAFKVQPVFMLINRSTQKKVFIIK